VNENIGTGARKLLSPDKRQLLNSSVVRDIGI
jgi:hypothetical protein